MGNRSRMHNGKDSRRYYDWLEHSSQDLIAAKILSEDDRCYRLAAFHCQQAIEKALKAYILLKSDVLVDGHNLTWLCRQAKKYDRGFHQWFDESADLNQCYIETRYPADIEREYTYKMVKNFYRMAKEMYQYIFAEIDKEFDRREKAEEDAPFYASNTMIKRFSVVLAGNLFYRTNLDFCEWRQYNKEAENCSVWNSFKQNRRGRAA